MLLRAATRGKITKIEVLPGFCKIERSASDVAATVAVLVKNSRPELPNKNSTCENVCIAMEKSKIQKITVEKFLKIGWKNKKSLITLANTSTLNFFV